jgi:hypothetical protein
MSRMPYKIVFQIPISDNKEIIYFDQLIHDKNHIKITTLYGTMLFNTTITLDWIVIMNQDISYLSFLSCRLCICFL